MSTKKSNVKEIKAPTMEDLQKQIENMTGMINEANLRMTAMKQSLSQRDDQITLMQVENWKLRKICEDNGLLKPAEVAEA